MAKIAVAAVLIAGAAWVGASFLFTGPFAPATYAATLESVWLATDRVEAVHAVLRVRTRPGEDFSFIDPQGEFMRVEIWIDGDRTRVEKRDRVRSFDGREGVLYLSRKNVAFRAAGRPSDLDLFWPATWVEQVRSLPERGVEVVRQEENGGVGRLLLRERGADTTPRDPAFLGEFDRETEIEWDLVTRRLTGLRRWIYRDGTRSLISETESIEYLPTLEPGIFGLELPDDVRWGGIKEGPLERLDLGPREVALRFFEAARKGDRETLELLCPSPAMVDWLLDKNRRPTKLYYIGEPFRAGKYVGVYVPYKVRVGSGLFVIKEHNLALRNDNAQNRWVFDGGI